MNGQVIQSAVVHGRSYISSRSVNFDEKAVFEIKKKLARYRETGNNFILGILCCWECMHTLYGVVDCFMK